MVYKSSSIAAGGAGTGGSGITSINADTTPAQLIVQGAGINVSTVGGTTTITNTSAGSAGVASVFGRTGVVSAQYGDYNFNLLAGTAAVSQGGTGQTSLTSHSVLLGEGAVTGVGFATTGIVSRILIDQGNADPSFQILSGDSSLSSNGVMVNTAVHGVTYPAVPATNTVPVVTGSNVVTYEAVPNAALANSAITIGAQTGLAGGGTVALGSAITVSMGTSIANSLAGYNSSGVFSDVSIGSNLSLSGGVLNGTNGPAPVTSVFGRTGAVIAQAGDYGFSLISGTAAVSQGGTGITSGTSGGVPYFSSSSSIASSASLASGAIVIGGGGVAPKSTNVLIDPNNNLYSYGTLINAQTGPYTLVTADTGKTVEISSSSASSLTFPNNLSQGLCGRFTQTGTGQITMIAASGATINNAAGYTKTAAQWATGDWYVTTNPSGTSAGYVLNFVGV